MLNWNEIKVYLYQRQTHSKVAGGEAFGGGLAIVGAGVGVEGVDVGQEGRELRWHSHAVILGRKARKVAVITAIVVSDGYDKKREN